MYTNSNVRKVYKTFHIESSPKENITRSIPHRNLVKYLGVNLDERLYYKNHLDIQISKTTKIFMQHKRLFYSKYLNPKIKIICYQLVIRPIITYGCSIWFNVSASLMEKNRLFERKCLRACLNMYRSEQSDYTEYISNLKLIYNEAKIPRVDNFIINLIRDFTFYK